jgi:hypothetical protein
MIHVGTLAWIKKAKVFVNKELELENLNLDIWFDMPCRSLPLSRLLILTSIKLDRKKSESPNAFHFGHFGTMIGLLSIIVLEILWIFVSTLIGPLLIPSNRRLSNAQWWPVRSGSSLDLTTSECILTHSDVVR